MVVFALLAPLLAAPGSVARAQTQAAPWAKRVTGYLRVRDGLLLKYSVLLPKTSGHFPSVLNYSGYDAGSIGGAAYQAGDTTMDAALDARLLREGYAVVGVNMRGTGCSEGGGKGFDLFSPKWGTDGYDAVEWIARQAWSNGAVGMANWSFAGLSQVFTAVQRPPHLKAIAPGMVVTDPWRDNGAPGGVPETQFPFTWWLYIQSRWAAAGQSAVADHDTRCLADLAANVVTGNGQGGNPAAWSAKQTRPEGALNTERNLSLRAGRINVPVLSMVAWQDEATGPRGGYFQDQLDPATTYLVATNGPHDSYMSTRFQAGVLLPFFDHYLKGTHNGFDKRPHVQLWMDSTGAGTDDASLQNMQPTQVITRPRLPVQVQPLTLALRSGGRLSTTRPRSNEVPTAYSYPGPGPDSNTWATSKPATGSTAFTTAPLSRTLTFEGAGSLNLWVSTAAPDADVQATITEVRPDGQEVYLQRGWVRLSERAQDPARATTLRPYPLLTIAAQAPLTSTKPVLARLEIEQFAHTFRKGSSIRIWIDAPSTTGEWGFSTIATPSIIQILHDSAHPSQLVLGQLQASGATTTLPACGTVLGEPAAPTRCPSRAVPDSPPAERAGTALSRQVRSAAWPECRRRRGSPPGPTAAPQPHAPPGTRARRTSSAHRPATESGTRPPGRPRPDVPDDPRPAPCPADPPASRTRPGSAPATPRRTGPPPSTRRSRHCRRPAPSPSRRSTPRSPQHAAPPRPPRPAARSDRCTGR